ncbi:MAG TPA: general stress protein [Candidatus Saccharimonadales bacterium]|nr:general stress protein [Candidatus Saccharimonadales bacterium]
MVKKKSSGWFGNSPAHAKSGSSGGKKTAELYGGEFYKSIGKKGGRVSPGNFKNSPQRAKLAGSRGGKARRKGSNISIE